MRVSAAGCSRSGPRSPVGFELSDPNRIAGGISTRSSSGSAASRCTFGAPSMQAIEARLRENLSRIDGVRLVVNRSVDPRYTDPSAKIIKGTLAAATSVHGNRPAVNMRVGASDARVFRKEGIPTVVFGPTPFYMGGADEYVLVDELIAVMRVHALTALDFLNQ